MSKIFRDISSIDTVPSHVETPSRICNHTAGKATFRSGLATQDRERLNFQFGTSNYVDNLPDRRLQPSSTQHAPLTLQTKLRTGTLAPRSAVSGAFGLQARNLPPSQTETTLSHQDRSHLHHKSAMSTASRTFGLVSEDLNSVNPQRDEISSLDLRSGGVNASLMPRTFGLQARNLTLHSQFLSENDVRRNREVDLLNCRRSNLSAVSRTFALGPERVGGGGSLSAYGGEGLVGDLRRNGSVSSSLMAKQFGHPGRNLTVHSTSVGERSRNCGVNGLSSGFQRFGSGVRGGVPEGETCSDEVFRRAALSRAMRGRNSLLSSRLFQSQSVERHCGDLSNINGFNVSHIGRREVDSLSESRLGLNVRSNWMDSQSIGGSVLGAASMKGQLMNLLENLHHSILNIGPQVTAEAVRVEFDKAKQGLENICEVSLPPSVREADAASVISQSSKYMCAAANEPATGTILDGGSLHLKSSKEVLKILISGKDGCRSKFNLSPRAEEGVRGKTGLTTSSEDSDDEQVGEFIFKKPKQVPRRRKMGCSFQSGTVGRAASEATSKALGLKQWYPVAFGSVLALCGLNEEGVAVKTDAVKKRLSGRRVELVSGLICNLIGSPSPMVSVLPKKMAALLKNGLTKRWRVLQRELVNCQTAEKNSAGRGTGTKAKEGGTRKLKINTLRGKARKSKSPKVLISPKGSGKGTEVLTRSGRTVKPPTMFWLGTGTNGMSGSGAPGVGKTSSAGRPPKKKSKRSEEGGPGSGGVGSPKKQKRKEGEFVWGKAKQPRRRSEGKWKKTGSASSSGRGDAEPSKVTSPKGSKRKEGEGACGVDSSGEAKRELRGSKRKMEVSGDADAVETKKSKLERVREVDVECGGEEEVDSAAKKGKRKKGGPAVGAGATEAKGKKSAGKRGNKKSKKKAAREVESEKNWEGKEANEFEEELELELDGIEIPEIANVSGNPQLSRSQLRVVSMETPPLKYFNSNLRLLRSATPKRSPDWCISQRSESEVKRFQKRREEALKKKTRMEVKQTIVTEKTTKNVQSKELKKLMEWITEKTVKSPAWNSRVVQYFIPSRKQEEEEEEEEEGEGGET